MPGHAPGFHMLKNHTHQTQLLVLEEYKLLKLCFSGIIIFPAATYPTILKIKNNQ